MADEKIYDENRLSIESEVFKDLRRRIDEKLTSIVEKMVEMNVNSGEVNIKIAIGFEDILLEEKMRKQTEIHSKVSGKVVHAEKGLAIPDGCNLGMIKLLAEDEDTGEFILEGC